MARPPPCPRGCGRDRRRGGPSLLHDRARPGRSRGSRSPDRGDRACRRRREHGDAGGVHGSAGAGRRRWVCLRDRTRQRGDGRVPAAPSRDRAATAGGVGRLRGGARRCHGRGRDRDRDGGRVGAGQRRVGGDQAGACMAQRLRVPLGGRGRHTHPSGPDRDRDPDPPSPQCDDRADGTRVGGADGGPRIRGRLGRAGTDRCRRRAERRPGTRDPTPSRSGTDDPPGPAISSGIGSRP